MKIKILKTSRGSENGINVEEYTQGRVYEVGLILARIFIKEGWAEEVKFQARLEKPKDQAPENLAKGPAPVNTKKKGKKHEAKAA